ncbi:hypothetical protein [Pendulispora albinea]|uniref:Uncharacterized protein n=1 Tax=Pendulispora albinea TaxID=2741071 RepID=A0ABZ2M8U9_9BACT
MGRARANATDITLATATDRSFGHAITFRAAALRRAIDPSALRPTTGPCRPARAATRRGPAASGRAAPCPNHRAAANGRFPGIRTARIGAARARFRTCGTRSGGGTRRAAGPLADGLRHEARSHLDHGICARALYGEDW